MSRAAKETLVKKTPIIYSDFMNNLQTHPNSGDIVRVVNVESIKQSLKNLVMLNRGEKPFQPNIGTDIHKSLFENMDSFSLNVMKQRIIDSIQQYEKRVRVLEVAVASSTTNENLVDIKISFYIINTGETANLSLILKRVR